MILVAKEFGSLPWPDAMGRNRGGPCLQRGCNHAIEGGDRRWASFARGHVELEMGSGDTTRARWTGWQWRRQGLA